MQLNRYMEVGIIHLMALFLPASGPAQELRKPAGSKLEIAIFAGGCFWCMEHPFDEIPGVVSTTSGYTGGKRPNPTYKEVSSGHSGHLEAVQVVFDPSKVGYDHLLDIFWHNVDPTDPTGQFCDTGSQYRTAVFFQNQGQQKLAEESKRALHASGRFPQGIVTEILPSGAFYPAEEYHQDYYRKNPARYKFYRTACGRDRRLKELWGG